MFTLFFSRFAHLNIRYDDIVVDVREECEKFGPIKSVSIPRSQDGIQSNVGKVFLEYEHVEDCTKAHAALGGRLFAGKSVIAVYYDEAKYAARVY
jgi:splicing factor U2AF subunit